MSDFRFDEAEFRQRAATRLLKSAPVKEGRSDDDLNPGWKATDPGPARRPGAVLGPIVLHEPELTMLLTQRTDHLASHAGQVAFPGGKIEQGDEDALAAALRE